MNLTEKQKNIISAISIQVLKINENNVLVSLSIPLRKYLNIKSDPFYKKTGVYELKLTNDKFKNVFLHKIELKMQEDPIPFVKNSIEYFNLLTNNEIPNFLLDKKTKRITQQITATISSIDSLKTLNFNLEYLINTLKKQEVLPKLKKYNINSLNELKEYNILNKINEVLIPFEILKNKEILNLFQNVKSFISSRSYKELTNEEEQIINNIIGITHQTSSLNQKIN